MRDIGEQEVINYGSYAVAMTREWGIKHYVNPVVYTYDDGLLYNAVNALIETSTFLKSLHSLKDNLKDFSDCNCGPASKRIRLTNTSKEAMDIFDFLSMNYNEELVHIISSHSKSIHETNLTIVSLTKPYRVVAGNDKEFIAYNDREWRKLYSNRVLFEENDEFNKWTSDNKPHFHKDPYLLQFDIHDVKAVMVAKDEEVEDLIKELDGIYGDALIDKLIREKSLVIGTKQKLEEYGF
jgi:hypothetical protein